MSRYSIRFAIGNETRSRKQELSDSDISEAAAKGWMKLDNGSVLPWHSIQHLKNLEDNSEPLYDCEDKYQEPNSPEDSTD